MAENRTRDSIRDVYGPRTPYYGEGQWPERIDRRTVEEPERWVQSCCVLCSNGCALDIGVRGNRIVGVRGRGVDPVNRGRLGPKGLHGWAANNSQDRLTRPLVREGGRLVETTWDEAMDLFVRTSKLIVEKHTGKACGIYGTGQLFIEEYHTIAMIAKAGLRTPHKDGNTRLCTATAEWALQESFGSDGQPGSYADLDVADTILFAGHDVAATQTVLFARILDRLAGPNPPKLIVIDPRTTEVARHAAVHLRPRVGSHVAVMNGLINLVIRSGNIDKAFIENHTVGFEELAATVSRYSPEEVERISQVPAADLTRAARILATTPRLLCSVCQAHRRLGHPLAVQRAAPRRRPAALHRLPLPHRVRRVRDLGPRPGLGGRGPSHRLPGERPGGPRDPPDRRVHPARRGARRPVPALADHRPDRLPLPHPDQDRAVEGAPRRRARCLRAVERRGRAEV